MKDWLKIRGEIPYSLGKERNTLPALPPPPITDCFRAQQEKNGGRLSFTVTSGEKLEVSSPRQGSSLGFTQNSSRMSSQHDDTAFSFVPEVTSHFGPTPDSLSPSHNFSQQLATLAWYMWFFIEGNKWTNSKCRISAIPMHSYLPFIWSYSYPAVDVCTLLWRVCF